MGHEHTHEAALGDGVDLDVGQERPPRVGAFLEGRAVGQLQALHDPVGYAPGAEDLELRVVEVGVLVIAAAADERVGDAHERGGGRFDLEQARGLVLRRLQEADEEAEPQSGRGGGGDERAATPHHVEVIAEVEGALGGSGRRDVGKGLHARS